MAAVLSITEAFNDYNSMEDLLTRIGLSRVCRERLMDEEGFETASDLAITNLKDLQAAIEFVNKLFGNVTGAGRIYFPPNRVMRVMRTFSGRPCPMRTPRRATSARGWAGAGAAWSRWQMLCPSPRSPSSSRSLPSMA